MALGEFDLIDRYFKPAGAARDDVVLGIGDDGAVLRPAPGIGVRLLSATATSGDPVRTAAGEDAALLGREVTATAMNRLTAHGARPAWLTLALTLPRAEPAWLEAFSDALLDLARRFDAALIGGDTTRGPLNVTVTAHGTIAADAAMARRDDDIYLTGHLGDGLLALAARAGRMPGLSQALRGALDRRLAERVPRVEAALAAAGLRGAARDTSGGLHAALRSLAGGALSARVECARLPLAAELPPLLAAAGGWPALAHAEGDIELCIAAPSEAGARLEAACAHAGVACTRIGALRDGDGDVVLIEAPLRGDPAP